MENKNIYSIQLFGIKKDTKEVFECRKVGDALDIGTRLKQHENAVTQRFENKVALDIGNRRDHEIHEILKNDLRICWDGEADQGYFTGREVFYMKDSNDDISYIDEIVSKWASGYYDVYERDINDTPYARQQEIIDAVFALFITGHIRVLIEAAPRTGKSFIALCIALKLGIKNITIITPFPDADGSFKKTVKRDIMMPGSVFEDARDFDSISFRKDVEGIHVIMISWSMLCDKKEKLSHLFKYGCDLIIVDETHRTSDSERSVNLLNKIPHRYELHLSGTPYNDRLSGRFDSSNTVTYDFIDRMKDALEAKIKLKGNLSKKEKKLYEFLASSPSIKFLMIFGMEDAVKEYKKQYPNFKVEDNLTLGKFLRPMYEPIVEIFFRNLATNIGDPLRKCLLNSDFKKEFDHILIFVEDREQADFVNIVLNNLKKENGGWTGYAIFSLSGIEEVDNYNSVESFVNKNQNDYRKTIHVSVGKATTGVTLNRLSSVWILRKINSAELLVQLSLRVGTSFEGKNNCNVVCFDSEQMITAQAVMAQMKARTTGESLIEILRDLNNCLPTLVWNGISFISISAEKILERTKNIVSKINTDDIEFESEIDTSVLKELMEFIGLDISSYSEIIGLGGQEGGKTEKIEIINSVKSKNIKEEDVNKIVKAARYIVEHLDWVISEYDCKTNTVELISQLNGFEINSKKISSKTWLAIVKAFGAKIIQQKIDEICVRLL